MSRPAADRHSLRCFLESFETGDLCAVLECRRERIEDLIAGAPLELPEALALAESGRADFAEICLMAGQPDWLRLVNRHAGEGERMFADPGEVVLALRPAQAAKALGISRRKFYELAKSGQIAAKKLDGVTLAPVEELRSYLQGLPDAFPSDKPERNIREREAHQ